MAKRNTYFQDEVIERKIDIKQLARVVRYAFPYRQFFFLVAALMVLASLLAMVTPLLLKQVINVAVPSEDFKMLAFLIAGMAALALTEIGINFAHQRIMGRVGHDIIANVRRDVFYKLQELPFDYFDSRPNGKVVVRVTEYVNDLANFFTNHLLMLLSYAAKLLIVTFFMLGLSPQLTGVVYAIVLPMVTIIFLLRYSIRKLFSAHRAKVSNRTAFLIETIMGEKIVKSYNRKESSEKIYQEVHQASVDQFMKIVHRGELNTPIVETFWNIGTTALYGTALYLILNGSSTMNAGIVVAFTSYMTQFSGPLTQLARSSSSLPRSVRTWSVSSTPLTILSPSRTRQTARNWNMSRGRLISMM